MRLQRSPLVSIQVPCPMCARDMDVDIVADDGVISDGKVVVKISCRYDHECAS